MPDTFTYAKVKSVKHVVTAAEDTAAEALVTVISGVTFPTDDWLYQMNIKTAEYAYRDVSGVDHHYNIQSGIVNVNDGSTNLSTGDIITVTGHFV